jgi:hypothetical protein
MKSRSFSKYKASQLGALRTTLQLVKLTYASSKRRTTNVRCLNTLVVVVVRLVDASLTDDKAQVLDSCSVTRVDSARLKESASSWSLLCILRSAGKPRYWTTWLLDYLTTGLLDYWTTWLLDYLSTCLLDYTSTWLHVYLTTRLLDYTSTCLHVYTSTCLHVYLSTCLLVYMSTCLHVYLTTWHAPIMRLAAWQCFTFLESFKCLSKNWCMWILYTGNEKQL